MGESWVSERWEPFSVAVYIPRSRKIIYIVPPWDRRFNAQSPKLLSLLAKYPEILGQFYVYALMLGDINAIELVKSILRKVERIKSG